jgi:hypothetical protein
MSITPSSAIVGVFRDRAMAEQAMNALHNAGFERDQIRYSGTSASGGGGFFDDIKSIFSGPSTASSNVANDLSDIGLSDQEAQYYANEQNNGNVVLAVKAPGREQEAQTIMHQYGAYNAQARTDALQGTMNSTQQSPNYAQQNVTSVTTSPNTIPPRTDANPYNAQPGVATSGPQGAPPITPNYNTNQPSAQSSAGQRLRTDNPAPQTVQPGANTIAPRQATSMSDAVASKQMDEMQQMQIQMQRMQQQLQDTKAQLQTAKEREAQVRTVKEHEQQMHAMKQQMQALQAELEATQTELKNINTRIGQN